VQGYLLDTNAISLVAPGTDTKRLTPGRAGFQRWIRAHSDNLFCSVITLAEVQAGISRLQRKDASRRAADLAHWLDAIVELYESRFLPLTVPVALEAGRLLDRAIGSGVDAGFEDAAIAATASVHDLTVVTEKTRHFQAFGVPIMPPEG
jgi:predicted nucleic acid-binding protein